MLADITSSEFDSVAKKANVSKGPCGSATSGMVPLFAEPPFDTVRLVKDCSKE